jgi:hypothetical protein
MRYIIQEEILPQSAVGLASLGTHPKLVQDSNRMSQALPA